MFAIEENQTNFTVHLSSFEVYIALNTSFRLSELIDLCICDRNDTQCFWCIHMGDVWHQLWQVYHRKFFLLLCQHIGTNDCKHSAKTSQTQRRRKKTPNKHIKRERETHTMKWERWNPCWYNLIKVFRAIRRKASCQSKAKVGNSLCLLSICSLYWSKVIVYYAIDKHTFAIDLAATNLQLIERWSWIFQTNDENGENKRKIWNYTLSCKLLLALHSYW